MMTGVSPGHSVPASWDSGDGQEWDLRLFQEGDLSRDRQLGSLLRLFAVPLLGD